jgi:hypothetical protein
MDLTPYVDHLRHHLLVAAQAGGEEARVLAERLTAPLDSATRLVLLDALSAAADEITRDLAPGSVDLRLRGGEPSFVVSPPPTEAAFDDTAEAGDNDWVEAAPAAHPEGDEGGTSRINLRLRDSLKLRAEQAANREGLSVNAWLVRAVAAALPPDDRDRHSRRHSQRVGQRYTGWVR